MREVGKGVRNRTDVELSKRGNFGMTSRQLLGILVVGCLIVLILVLHLIPREQALFIFEPRLVAPVFNTIFVFLLPLAVTFVTFQSFIVAGSLNVLFFSCGVFLVAIAMIASTWLQPTFSANVGVTIHNTGSLIASLVYATGVVATFSSWESKADARRRRFIALTSYSSAAAFIILLSAAAVGGKLPIFFQPGTGGTAVRQWILGGTIVLFVAASLFLMKTFFKRRAAFLYWHSLAFFLYACGLLGVWMQRSLGDPIGWVGRSAQWTSGIYLMVAGLTALREARASGVSVGAAVASFFRESELNYKALIETLTDAVVSTDAQGRILGWNLAAERMFGYAQQEAIGVTLAKLAILQNPDSIAQPIKTLQVSTTSETQAKRKNGEEFPAEVSVSSRETQGGVFWTFIIRDVTHRKQVEEELRKSRNELETQVQVRTAELAGVNKTLRDLSSKLLIAQEEERKRIAGEIHDTLGSCLSGIKFRVDSALQQAGKDANVAMESLNTIIPVIQEGIEECRRMQMDLRPPMLDDLGLLATLSWFCRRFQTIYSKVHVEVEQTLEERDIPNSLKIVIYRVLQEGMNNIGKHSKADHVHLSLRKMDGRIQLLLEDNGQGFDLKKALASANTKRGLGLTSMRERAELSGGTFVIESTEGIGTTIRISWLVTS